MKLLASFATGILVTLGTFIALLFARVLFRDTVTFGLWIFAWPVWFLRYLPGIPYNTLIWLSLAVGMLLDVFLISFVTYCVLRVIASQRNRARIPIPPPPQPPTF